MLGCHCSQRRTTTQIKNKMLRKYKDKARAPKELQQQQTKPNLSPSQISMKPHTKHLLQFLYPNILSAF